MFNCRFYRLYKFFIHSTIVRQGETTKLGYFFGLVLLNDDGRVRRGHGRGRFLQRWLRARHPPWL